MKDFWSNKWVRLLIHTPHGCLAAYLVILAITDHWAYAVAAGIWTVMIITYQYLEEIAIGDNSYLDFRGYMTGFALTMAVFLVRVDITTVIC